jgi:hypothetical protein
VLRRQGGGVMGQIAAAYGQGWASAGACRRIRDGQEVWPVSIPRG